MFFSLPLLLGASVAYSNAFIVVSILTHKHKLRFREIIYIVLSGLIASFTALSIYVADISIHAPDLVFDIAIAFFMYQYLRSFRAYSVKKTVILICSSAILASLVTHMFTAFFEIYLSNYIYMPVAFAMSAAIMLIPLYFVLSVATAKLFMKFSQKLRKTISQTEQVQTALLGIIIFLAISFRAGVVVRMHQNQGYTSNLFIFNLGFFVAYSLLAYISFILFTRSLEAKFEAQRKVTEQKDLQYYTDQLERQQTAMRKFKHDYQNILASLDSFIAEGDWAGLRQYYSSSIKTASEVITREDFALENLSKIKLREIKGIMAAKLLQAQDAGINAYIEVTAEIESFPIDSVQFVRIIGIIMDNAIEALTELCGGTLLVGFFKGETGITLIVKNSCRKDLTNIRKIRQVGFTTKGENRGLGLAILSEIVNSYGNVTLETSIEEGYFIQKLKMREGD